MADAYVAQRCCAIFHSTWQSKPRSKSGRQNSQNRMTISTRPCLASVWSCATSPVCRRFMRTWIMEITDPSLYSRTKFAWQTTWGPTHIKTCSTGKFSMGRFSAQKRSWSSRGDAQRGHNHDADPWERAAGRDVTFQKCKCENGLRQLTGLEEALRQLKLLANVGRAKINLTPGAKYDGGMMADAQKLQDSMMYKNLRHEMELSCPLCRNCPLNTTHTRQVQSE